LPTLTIIAGVIDVAGGISSADQERAPSQKKSHQHARSEKVAPDLQNSEHAVDYHRPPVEIRTFPATKPENPRQPDEAQKKSEKVAPDLQNREHAVD
jgi:hypothetical protein